MTSNTLFSNEPLSFDYQHDSTAKVAGKKHPRPTELSFLLNSDEEESTAQLLGGLRKELPSGSNKSHAEVMTLDMKLQELANSAEIRTPKIRPLELSTTPKQSPRLNSAALTPTVAPFLNRHIADNNRRVSSYCYRHNPNVTCNRQADAQALNRLQADLELLEGPDREAISNVWSMFSTAPSGHRRLLLHGLLAQCCFPQLSEVSSLCRELIRIDFISALPVELSFKILCYLDTSSLCNAAQVSRRWKELADDDVVWHRMCEQHIDRKCTKCGWGLPLLEKTRLRNSKRQIEQRESELARTQRERSDQPHYQITASESSNDNQGSDALDSGTLAVHDTRKRHRDSEGEFAGNSKKTRPWKEVYAERYKVEQNWRTGRYFIKEFKSEEAGVSSLQFDECYLITGMDNGSVKVWDVDSGELLRTLSGHTQNVSSLKFDSSKLVTASWDRTVRIWNYRTGECVCTFPGHLDKVLCIDFDHNLIASGSADRNVKVWNFDTKQFFTLRGHNDVVHSVKIHSASDTLFSVSEDAEVRMWCLDSRNCIQIFSPTHLAPVQSILPLRVEHIGEAEELTSEGAEIVPSSAVRNPNTGIIAGDGQVRTPKMVDREQCPNYILTASLDNTIKLWDVRTGKCIRTMFGHLEGIWSVAADTFRIVSGGKDKLVKLWDVQTGKCLNTFSGHTAAVTAVGISDSRFASGSHDGLVRIYCFDSREC